MAVIRIVALAVVLGIGIFNPGVWADDRADEQWYSSDPDDMTALLGTTWELTFTSGSDTLTFESESQTNDEGYVFLKYQDQDGNPGTVSYTDFPDQIGGERGFYGYARVDADPAFYRLYWFRISGNNASGYQGDQAISGDSSISIHSMTGIRTDNIEPEPETGTLVTPHLWIRAVIDTEEKGPVEAVWQEGGRDNTQAGDTVIWGYFYASPDDVSWGSRQNPDLFVKIWFDHGGRLDVNFFHVSVPDIEVFSAYPYEDTEDLKGMTTMTNRYIRQWYEGEQKGMDVSEEDGLPASDDVPSANPTGYAATNTLRIGTMINTEEKGAVEALWRRGGRATTERGDQVFWGHFYANPDDVAWGNENNPDLFVKVWFDAGGRVDVNYFHVSVPDIEVCSALPDQGTYSKKGTTLMSDRYIRHGYDMDPAQFQYEMVRIETSYGDIVMWLYDETPLHKENILRLTEAGFYNGSIFHRVIDDFVVQGGSPGPSWTGSLPDLIDAEFNKSLTHVYGALGAARTSSNNPEKKSGSQFYIVEDANGEHGLDMNYTVFGHVIHGMDAVGTIAEVETNSKDRPLEDIPMTKVEKILLTEKELLDTYGFVIP